MGGKRLWPFLALTELVVLLVLANYYFNPLRFNSHCLAGDFPFIQARPNPTNWATERPSIASPVSTATTVTSLPLSSLER